MVARIYKVTAVQTGKTHLIKATSPAQAIRHLTAKAFDITAAKVTDVAELMSAGVQIEDGERDNETGSLDL